MKALLRTSLILLALLPLACPAGSGAARAAQAGSPVQWRLTQIPREPLRAGEEFAVAAQAAIATGWHLYALDEPEDGPVPLEFSAEPGGTVTLVSVAADRPEREPAPGTAVPVNFYRGEPRFRLRLRAGPALRGGTAEAVIAIRFQACNKHLCLPPQTARLSFQLRRQD